MKQEKWELFSALNGDGNKKEVFGHALKNQTNRPEKDLASRLAKWLDLIDR